MAFKIVVDQETAESEVNALLDRKCILPKQRERLQPAIDAVIEGVQYGYVSIEESGKITQKLITPIGELTELTYSARILPETINKGISALKVDNQTNRNLVYITSYTGQLAATINRLEPADRNICESIAFFFQ